jgi:AraC-like DNA-binding protein
MDTLTFALRIAGSTGLALVAALLLRDVRPLQTGVWLGLFCLSALAHLLCPLALAGSFSASTLLLQLGCFGLPGFFWLAASALFNERFRAGPLHLAALVVLEGLGFWHFGTAPGTPLILSVDARGIALVAHQFLSLALVVWVLISAYRGRANDLVEPRRTLRSMMVVGTGSYMLLVVASEILLNGRPPDPVIELANLAFILALIAAGAMSLLGVCGAANVTVSALPIKTLSSVDPALTERIRSLMETGAYRQPGLTIAGLALQLGTREETLRRTINAGMGFRNFSAFLNAHRIEEAKRLLLVNLREGRMPVLTIAMDLGYGSLGPFNRAFKEITGMTPTQYRLTAGYNSGP